MQADSTILTQLKPGMIVRGPMLPEPIEVILVQRIGESIKLVGKGLTTGLVQDPILSLEQAALLVLPPSSAVYDGDARRFKLGIEALRLGLAHEYDPFFSLSIARVDPLPHQLEAVYDYFLKSPRVRFLLADDPGAGKTVMAGLLIKELKFRGLVRRVLVITPANLTFQWQRELKDKFHEQFEVVKGDVLRANYGTNPWMEKSQCITSVTWVSTRDDARESLLRSHWDLIIVDEAHKMSASRDDKKTLAYRLGEHLSSMTDHYLLMTATPHKGDPEHFRLFLELLDPDIYSDRKSLEEALHHSNAPFYLRRTKEALVTFPDPVTRKSKKIFTQRDVRTIEFEINNDELGFYQSLTRYVEDQSIKAASESGARARALSFTMAMLQRRFASSLYAVRRSLERMAEKRKLILKDPAGYRDQQIQQRIPEDFDEYTDEERQEFIEKLEEVVPSYDPLILKEDIGELEKLAREARELEQAEVETKLTRLKEILTAEKLFEDPNMKLLIFTEHKDTLDYLAGDGKNNRPLGKLREWGLKVTQIYGGMKIGDRDTPGTRIHAEREFKESAQILVATEAAGEGINLQFCWLMINYDIPWNPIRLEQRMGRIHRYGQEKNCLIFNFVAGNTREGRVLQKLFDRIKQIEEDLDPNQTGKVFNVVGNIFPANQLEKYVREMYAKSITEDTLIQRIVDEVDIDRIRKITQSTLEGLAKRELNLSALIGRAEEAKERRLVPEVIEDFFTTAAPIADIQLKEIKPQSHIYRPNRTPRPLLTIGEKNELQYGKLGKEYDRIVFDKFVLSNEPTAEWVTPGHPLFEALRHHILAIAQTELEKGVVLLDVHRKEPARLDVFAASILDGRGNTLHKRLFVIEMDIAGAMLLKQPTIFLDLIIPDLGFSFPEKELENRLADPATVQAFLVEKGLQQFLREEQEKRTKETEIIRRHLEVSLSASIDKAQHQLAEVESERLSGSATAGFEGRLKIATERYEELVRRLENRRNELEQERHCSIGNIQLVGRAWVLPHPERESAEIGGVIRDDDEVESLAVQTVIRYEEARGMNVQSVESENRGFDLISRRPHPEDPQTSIEVRFIEVKGRSAVGEILLTTNEFKKAQSMKEDYWLYVVYNCASHPEIQIVRDPARLGWKPITKVEHYHIGSDAILKAVS